MKNYTVRVGGYDMVMKLSDEDARTRGLLAEEKPAPVAETKKVDPENKAGAPKKRGRPRIQRDDD